MPRLGSGSGSGSGSPSAGPAAGAGASAQGGRTGSRQRDTLDTPKSRVQRLLLRSVPLRFPFYNPPRAGSGGTGGNNRGGAGAFVTSGEAGALPIRIRLAFVLLNVLDLTVLGLLGFHPHAQEYVFLNDKVLHFFGFFFATMLFYGIWDVDESARRIWFWRHFPLLLSSFTCFLMGSIGSEFVQALLPYKTFQWADILANMLGSGLGLFLSYHAERRYRARRELERLYQPLDANDDDDDDDEEDGDAFAMDLEFGIGDDDDGNPWNEDEERRQTDRGGGKRDNDAHGGGVGPQATTEGRLRSSDADGR
ncbi:unnamed protein product [Tilletia controversa]|uniref:VanZ-like domain-containing protein n=1 Tax=Tilletia controversa TaxID=13291 RepID=A0A8X7SW83_9BASI|nr:hypothetical protein CF328_g4254 [Tilletia controversa]KAE8246318.1 hypothetical protein A4X06_0g5063 [Tilletia controversa]CAD6900546.1 unnamed protein product [Tilletia controversa]